MNILIAVLLILAGLSFYGYLAYFIYKISEMAEDDERKAKERMRKFLEKCEYTK